MVLNKNRINSTLVLCVLFYLSFEKQAVSEAPELAVQAGHSEAITSFAFSREGRILVSGSYDSTVVFWDTKTLKQIRSVKLSDRTVSVTMNPQADMVAAAGFDDCEINLLDTASGQIMKILKGYYSGTSCIAFSPNGKLLASAQVGAVVIWDISTGKETANFGYCTDMENSNGVLAVTFSPDGRFLAAGGYCGVIEIYELASGKTVGQWQGHSGPIPTLAFSNDSKTLASGGGDANNQTIKLWHVPSGRAVCTLATNQTMVNCVVFSPDGNKIACGSNAWWPYPSLQLWDAVTGKELWGQMADSRGVKCVAFKGNGQIVATAGEDRLITFWDSSTGTNVGELQSHATSVKCLAFSPVNRLLAAQGNDGVGIWNLDKEPLHTFISKPLFSYVSCLTYSPNGEILAMGGAGAWGGGDESDVCLWDVNKGTNVLKIKANTEVVDSVAFSPDGTVLATGGADNMIEFRKTDSGEKIGEIKVNSAHKDQNLAYHVNSIAFSPDGRVLASGSGWSDVDDGQLALWDVSTKKAKQILTNNCWRVNDAQAMRDILISKYGFDPSHIEVLLDAQATRDTILREIQKQLIDAAAPGDICLFYYAGHGSRIRNLKSNKPSGMDSTIVPADSIKGVMDIRDKELARLFSRALDKNVVLTAIFDSCNSGSIARGMPRAGRSRYLLPGTIVVSDPPDLGPTPEQRGALILSATQDDMEAADTEDEQGIPHGAFTSAFLQTLRASSAAVSAGEIFLGTETLLQADQPGQVPVMAGTIERRRKPLFGESTGTDSGLMVVGVISCVPEIGQMTLAGGRALGLENGCELRRLPRTGETSNNVPERIQIIEVQGFSRSIAQIISGDINQIKNGDLFVVDRWVYPSEANLKVWLNSADLSLADLYSLAPQLTVLRNSSRIQWIADPTVETPAHILSWEKSGWNLSGIGPVGRKLNAQVIIQKLAPSTNIKPSLFVDLPVPRELTKGFQLGDRAQINSIIIVANPSAAQYNLAGQWQDGTIEYAWVRPDSTEENPQNNPLPARTDWFQVTDKDDSIKSTLRGLEDKAVCIGRLKAWLTLASPPDVGDFPYHLELLNTNTKQKKNNDDTVFEGEPYGLVLVADPAADLQRENVAKRWVYVVGIDSWGRTQLLFPPDTQGNVGNHLPIDPPDISQQTYPSEMVLGDPMNPTIFTVGSPFGVDTYVLLASDEPIMEPSVLDSEGVRTRGMENNPLATLLSNVGARTRGQDLAVPTDWSIERISIRSAPVPP